MNRPIRRVGYAVTVLILLLVAQLTYLQVVDANNLANDPNNVRKQLKDFNRARGDILTADGQIVAQSIPTTGDFKYRRDYPQTGLFAHVVGYQSFVNLVGSTGVEASYDKVLTGQDTSLQLDNLGNTLSGKAVTNDVVLSLTESAQKAAESALRGQRGSVVALDVQTGAVVAMYSNPTFNPNGLSVHSTPFVQNTFNAINSEANGKPALQRAVPRPLLPRFDVQGDHEQVGDRGRAHVDRRPGVRRSERFPDPGNRHDSCATSVAARAAARCG